MLDQRRGGGGASPADQELLDDLAVLEKSSSGPIRAGEAWLVRAAVLLASPVWGALIGLAVALRLVRGRLPLIALHRRAGFGRRPLLVPKVATMSVEPNRRRLGGLIEIADGSPAYPTVEAAPERWLRHSGLDELPQLVLVVAGRMRVVGPRPVSFDEIVEMDGGEGAVGVDILHPGLVGVWQLLDRHSYELPARRELDQFMIEHWSSALQRRVVRIAAGQAVRRFVGR